MRLRSRRGTSQRSSTTTPKPPLCRMRSAALKAFSMRALPRIHRRRRRFTPASDAASGSKASRLSTTAQKSPRVLASAKNLCKNAVFPQETAPNSSLTAPGGNPVISSYVRLNYSLGTTRRMSICQWICKIKVAEVGNCKRQKRWSGRPGSNRRRPAWEYERRL